MQIQVQIIITPTPEEVEQARDELRRRLFYAKAKDTIGGRDGWVKLCKMCDGFEYAEALEYLSAIHGRGQATRNVCIDNLKTILRGMGYDIT